jgi:uncharacterized protein (DUF983 family)
MSWNQSNLRALLLCKCPQCKKGDLFKEPNAYRLLHMTSMHSRCTECDEDFQREPGFYFGAAYVSYALTVALWVAVWVALHVFNALEWIEFGFYSHVFTFLSVGITCLLLLMPLIYRISRSIWIRLFVKPR